MAKPGYRVFETAVGDIERLSPHFVRVTFRSDDLREVGWDGPDQRTKVVLPLDGSGFDSVPSGGDWFAAWRALPDERRNPIRTYTIRCARPELGELDVDFVAHGDSGPASRWIAAARVGDPIRLVAPDATSRAESGGWEWNPGAARNSRKTRAERSSSRFPMRATHSISPHLRASRCAGWLAARRPKPTARASSKR
jgi:NADPH-dependent ferric siderophore reductase